MGCADAEWMLGQFILCHAHLGLHGEARGQRQQRNGEKDLRHARRARQSGFMRSFAPGRTRQGTERALNGDIAKRAVITRRVGDEPRGVDAVPQPDYVTVNRGAAHGHTQH